MDANLLVLYVVGVVNRRRIRQFKRTRKHTEEDFDLLLRVLGRFDTLFSVSHVLAEVSNLTDLSGRERLLARECLKRTIALLKEPELPSARATEHKCYLRLGLADAAVATAASDHGLEVLTDDLDLYLALAKESIAVTNFTHLREARWRADGD